MAETGSQENQKLRWRITVSGTVQGVGFRPFVYQLARKHKLTGWVCNTPHGVLIEAEGDENDLESFLKSLSSESPALASISGVQAEPVSPLRSSGFAIRTSIDGTEVQPIVPPDVATCADCMADVAASSNRRHKYPFTNCTNCGPRFTIIRSIPYDRPNTTMHGFRMCPECQAEYEDPSNRRFHAQPNACPACGPHLNLNGESYRSDCEAVSKAAELLRNGTIVAVKGLGGYHLACDARNTKALETLRTRKGRVEKPFAVMSTDLDEIRQVCVVDRTSETLLLSPERPIVLMPARPDNGISPLVAPGTTSLGIMLPYTPLHQLLLSKSPPTLVMTSGNLSEEPIAYRDEEALERLGHIADHILAHDRPIHMACDDSVARVCDGVPLVIRRARGYVPRPIELDMDMPQVLACGGDLKSTFCLTKGKLALLSQHLGDLDNVPTLEHYQQVVDHFCQFFAVQPEVIAHDLHPDYHSTHYATAMQASERIGVQHHHAHIASCMAENHLSEPVIGVAFDGTGYGSDGHIWGGEFLVADYDGFQRVAHLAYVPMPGGEAAVRKPGRMALAYLLHTFGLSGENMGVEIMPGISPAEAYAVRVQVEQGLNAPLTSSMGRLFDAVSALLGICAEVTYEAQAAVELEAKGCVRTGEIYGYDVSEHAPGTLEIDVRPMIAEIVEAIQRKAPVEAISSAFHSTIADMVVRVCCMIRDKAGLNRVALSGGVFQNVRLLETVPARLRSSGFDVFRHSIVPCNDGGISLGQAAIAARRYRR